MAWPIRGLDCRTHDNETFVDANNLDSHYGWDTLSDFIFVDWTAQVFGFLEPPSRYGSDETSTWRSVDCNATSYRLVRGVKCVQPRTQLHSIAAGQLMAARGPPAGVP